ncbi:MAG TPA: HD domain-containing protein [Desulfobacteria bacterium]|nr:HD domain-containing protein [Desulfobacteria bacterium]
MIRVEAILRDSRYQEHIKKNMIEETDRKFCRHNFQHLVDVARITYILLLEAGDINRFMDENCFAPDVAKEIVYASALLHDIGRWREYETGEDHALVSAQLAVEILCEAGFNDKEINIICTGIREHRRTCENASLLGELLNRADNLSRLCLQCQAGDECYKLETMETGRRFLIY